MNEEKLIADAWEAGSEDYFADDPRRDAFEEGFMRGARWHESLPLAERLTEEEKEKIRHLYLHYDDEYKDEDFPSTNYTFALELAFKSIFGKNLFNPTEQ